jgi:hypothetical protein
MADTTTEKKAEETPAQELARRFLQLPRPRNQKSAHARERRWQAERDLLVAVMSRIWPSHLAQPEGHRMDSLMSEIICIHSPVGQLAWGMPPDHAPWFAHLKHDRTCRWDRHNMGDRMARLRKLLTLHEDELFASRRRARPGKPTTKKKKGRTR